MFVGLFYRLKWKIFILIFKSFEALNESVERNYKETNHKESGEYGTTSDNNQIHIVLAYFVLTFVKEKFIYLKMDL